jgi:hypothetical protein
MAAASRPMSRLVSHGCELRPNQSLKLTETTGNDFAARQKNDLRRARCLPRVLSTRDRLQINTTELRPGMRPLKLFSLT